MFDNKLPLRFIIASHAINFLATGLVKFGISLWVYQKTQSIQLFSMMAISGFIPGIIVSVFSGTLVDRHNLKRILLSCQTTLIIALLSVGLLFGTLEDGLWWFFALTIIFSAVEAFSWPAFSVVVTKLADKDSLANYNGVIETSVAVSFLSAPALAGILFEYIDILGLLIISIVLLSLSILCVVQSKCDFEHNKPRKQSQSLLEEAKAGFCFVFEHTQLRNLLFLFSLINIVAAIHVVLLVPFTLSMMTEATAGFARSMEGVGMLLGGTLLATLGTSKNNYSAIVLGIWCFCFFILLMSISFHDHFVMLLLLIAGINLSYVNGCSQTQWQKHTPIEIQGRVFALRRMMAWLSMPIGYLITPLLTEYSANYLLAQPEWASYFNHGEKPEFRFTLFVVSIIAIALLTIGSTVRLFRRPVNVLII